MKNIMFQGDRVIIDGVTYYREQPELTNAKKVLDKIEWIRGDVKTELDRAQALYDNMKEEGLTFGSIEAEGYLRACKTIWNQIEFIETECEEN